MKEIIFEAEIKQAILKVSEINSFAYAPYSKFQVSAVLYLPQKKVFVSGVNVENMSYGGTICAERSAICSAISHYGKTEFGFIVVYTKSTSLTPPCGICRQFMSEFCNGDFPVILCNETGEQKNLLLADLLPMPFEKF